MVIPDDRMCLYALIENIFRRRLSLVSLYVRSAMVIPEDVSE